MTTDSLVKSLHPLEVRVLLDTAPDRHIDRSTLQQRLDFSPGHANQALSWLEAKELIVPVERRTVLRYERTALGADFAANGTPAERIFRALRTHGPMSISDLRAATGLAHSDVGSQYGRLSKVGVVSMDAQKQVHIESEAHLPSADITLRGLLERAATDPLVEAELTDEERVIVAANAKKRGAAGAMFRIVERDIVTYRPTDAAVRLADELRDRGVAGDEVGQLTPELLTGGRWRAAVFRPYAIGTAPARVLPGRRNPYSEYVASVKDKLVALGFEEFDGPLVETEFWNSDALFMPQFHSARDIHDVYYLESPQRVTHIAEPYLSNVAAAHENGWQTGSRGWNYAFDRDFTRRLILRSQGTVMSAKQLSTAKVPGKYFGILRCFRHDQVDATHLSDFYQTDGIVLGEHVNLRTLLGLLKMFAEELAGATEVKYVPGYFPFTEPSIEVHIKHPRLGWFELGGSGIFRPEVTGPMGVDVPVLAWGLGIDRMALMHLGLSDLRELFSNDIERVRLRRTIG